MNNQIEMIDHVLGELQKNVARSTMQFFLIGWVLLAGCIMHLLLGVMGKYEWIQINWIIVPIASVLLGLISGFRQKVPTHMSTSEKLLKHVWGVVGLVMIYLSFIAPLLGIIPQTIVLPVILSLMFISVVITGLTIKHTPTIILSSLWFIGSVVISYVPPEYYVHILLVVVLGGYLLPAYLIKVKFR